MPAVGIAFVGFFVAVVIEIVGVLVEHDGKHKRGTRRRGDVRRQGAARSAGPLTMNTSSKHGWSLQRRKPSWGLKILSPSFLAVE